MTEKQEEKPFLTPAQAVAVAALLGGRAEAKREGPGRAYCVDPEHKREFRDLATFAAFFATLHPITDA